MSLRVFPLWLSSEKRTGRVTPGATTATSVNRDGGSDQGGSVQTGEVGRFEIRLENLEAVESVAKTILGGVRERSAPCGMSWFCVHIQTEKPSMQQHGCNSGGRGAGRGCAEPATPRGVGSRQMERTLSTGREGGVRSAKWIPSSNLSNDMIFVEFFFYIPHMWYRRSKEK